MNGNISFGVSLYSFTQQWYERPGFGFADMFKILRKLGISKFEVVGSQSFDQYPVPRRESLEELVELSDLYGMTPFSYGGQIDVGKYTGREMDAEEIFREVCDEFRVAQMLGCKYLRGTGHLPLSEYERLVEMAERYDIRYGMEIHSPSKPSDANIQAMAAEIDRIGSSYLGFVPDFGCFIERPSQKLLNYYKNLGAKMEIVDYIVKNRHSGKTEEDVWEEVKPMGAGEADHIAVSELFGHQSFGPADLEGFKTVLPYSIYFHGKFYDIDENLVESTIPYDKLIQYILESGFDGVMMTEYEGHALYTDDAEEQVARHIGMQKRILKNLIG
ncbi:MAG: TIM barrel protein [Anaerolineales bacterium]